MTAENKPNIVRVERDENVKAGQFYKVFYDKPTEDDYVTNKDGEAYTYIIAVDELHAWSMVQIALDVQYGND